MWRAFAVACLLAVPAAGAQSTAPAGSPPVCTIVSPAASATVPLGGNQTFSANCTDKDGNLFWIEWSRDDGSGLAQHPARPTSETNRSYTGSTTLSFAAVGSHWVKAVGIDRSNLRSAPVQWAVEVTDRRIVPPALSPSLPDTGTEEDGAWVLPLDPVQAFSAVVGAIVGLGGLALAVVQHRRRRGDGEEAVGVAGVRMEQKVGTNMGTVIGHAGQVVVQAPAPTVPSGVQPHKQDLYLALARAYEVLDRLPVDSKVLVARELVRDLMKKLASGEIPVREARQPVANAIRELMVWDAMKKDARRPRVSADDLAILRVAGNKLDE